jgi:hypothetical protein
VNGADRAAAVFTDRTRDPAITDIQLATGATTSSAGTTSSITTKVSTFHCKCTDMGNDRNGAGYTIDIADFLTNHPEMQAHLQELAERRTRFLESLSPEERARAEARAAAEEQDARRLCEEDERSYDELVKGAEQVLMERHHEIGGDRKAGTIGTLTEVGRAYGLSGRAVGCVLDLHGLRERVDVDADQFPSPLTIALNRFQEEQRERWAAFNAIFRPHHPIETPKERPQTTLHLLRGLINGFAIHDHFDGRDYWISAKVAPLLEPHAKRKP